MALPPPSVPKSLLATLQYSLRYHYPLSPEELWFWQISSQFSRQYINSLTLKKYCPSNLIKQKQERFNFSQTKWLIARQIGEWLYKIPTVQAVFVTGSLAMNNTPIDDDIDIFIVTTPHTLWFTRFLVVSLLTFKSIRRPPHLTEHSSQRVANRICDNLYLDISHLSVSPQTLYLAHEILQAKPLFDKSGIHYQLLIQNPWVKDYLPIAYSETLKKLKPVKISNHHHMLNTFYLILNTIFFIPQYLYMFPFKTTEKISLGSAFFHPISNRDQNPSCSNEVLILSKERG